MQDENLKFLKCTSNFHVVNVVRNIVVVIQWHLDRNLDILLLLLHQSEGGSSNFVTEDASIINRKGCMGRQNVNEETAEKANGPERIIMTYEVTFHLSGKSIHTLF